MWIVASLVCFRFCLLALLAGPNGFLSFVFSLVVLNHLNLPARLARLKCLCRPPCVVVVPGNWSPAGWFVPSRNLDATQCAVFIKWYSRFVDVGNPSRLMGAIKCVCVRVRSRLPCLGVISNLFFVWPTLNECGRGGSSSSYCLCLVAACVCCCSYVSLLATIGCRV